MDYNEFRERYHYDPVSDLLGQGGFGRVYRAHDTVIGHRVALKVFSRDVPQQYDLISEIQRAIILNHRNICRYHGAEVLKGTNALGESQTIQVGIMEYVEGGTIDQFLMRHPHYRIKLLIDVLRGMSYLHQHQPPIIHRDMKPSNVLVGFEDGLPVAKITDFGISKSASVSGAGVSVVGLGTYAYMAPEQLNPARYGVNGKINCNLDLWSFGAMTIELLTGVLPFSAGDPDASTGQILEAIIRGVLPEAMNRFEEPYRSMLRRCMVQHAGERARTAGELISILEGTVTSPLPSPPPLPVSGRKDLAEERQNLRKKHGYPMILYPGRGRPLGLLLMSVLFTVGGFAMGSTSAGSDQVVGYLGGAFFGLLSLGFLYMLFPGSMFLRVDEAGFTYRTLFGEKSHGWEEIGLFVAVDLGTTRVNRTVGWRYLPQYRTSKLLGKVSQALTSCDDALPQVTYGGKTALELAAMMNECKRDAQEQAP